MDKQYYYVDPQGVRQGPLPLSSIPREQITPTTKVWCKGMDTWEDAGNVPDFAPLLAQPIANEPQQPPTPPQPQGYQAPSQGYQAPQQSYQAPAPMSDESKKALITSLIVVGSFVLIILIGVGVIFLSTKKSHHSSDDYAALDSISVDTTAVDSTADYAVDEDTIDYAAQEDYGYDDNEEQEVTLVGYMTDETGDNPIRITFRQSGDNIYNCVYTNVALGGKIRMQGTVSGNHYTFSGKDGRNDFIINVDDGGTSVYGSARDGNKHLDVVLKYD